MYEFKLPDVGEGLSQGEIVQWHVAVGDTVREDQSLVDVQTDKAIVEIPAPVAGTVTGLGGGPGDVLAVGAILAVFETRSEVATPASAPPADGDRGPPQGAPRAAASPAGRVRASPAVRKLARGLRVDLSALRGSGARGQITRSDVEAGRGGPGTAERSASPAPERPPEGEDRVEPLRGLRRQIARTMEAAWRDVPHIFSMHEVDATELVRARRSLNEELAGEQVHLSYLPFFVQACVAALKAHPRFNASLDMSGERIIYRHRYNIGIATATPDGLIVTVVADAERRTLRELALEIEDLAGLARQRRVTPAQISGGTFTISNYGSYGAWMGTPIIRPPEVAIAGFGRIREAVVPVDGEPGIRSLLPMCISTDHRLNDGDHLGAFVDTMVSYLREPVRLLSQA